MTAVETYDDGVPPRRGVSLAKGPVAIIGVLSLALGVLGFITASRSFTMHAPDGTVNGTTFKKNYGTEYLFTPPELFAVTHFPDAQKWQLLERPLSRADFFRRPVLAPS